MNLQRLFAAEISEAGKLRMSEAARTEMDRYLATLKGKPVQIRIGEPVRKRSLDQNAYLHAEPFPKLAKEWGESIARTKLICMGEFWGWEPCRVTSSVLPVKAHTSDMTVPECTLFIDWLIPWAAEEHGVEITLPEEWQRAAA